VVVNGTAGEGYWAVYYLLKAGFCNVRATARRPDSKLAVRLRELDFDGRRCEVVGARTDCQSELEAAFAGADGIYGTSVYNIHAKRYRPANPEERVQCDAVVGAARACPTLRHFVWQTMTRFELPPAELGLEAPIHFRTKWQYEDVIRETNLPWTFLRQPAYLRQIKFGMQYRNRLVYPYPPDTRLAYVAEEDLGKIVAAVFAQRDAFLHRSVNAVSEVLTPVELARRAHALSPDFNPEYRVASWVENALFDYVVVGLNPSFRYPRQINRNLMAGNYFAMTRRDREACAELIAPLELCTVEDWLRGHFGMAPAKAGSG